MSAVVKFIMPLIKMFCVLCILHIEKILLLITLYLNMFALLYYGRKKPKHVEFLSFSNTLQLFVNIAL
jgi:hypothetical protein